MSEVIASGAARLTPQVLQMQWVTGVMWMIWVMGRAASWLTILIITYTIGRRLVISWLGIMIHYSCTIEPLTVMWGTPEVPVDIFSNLSATLSS